MLAATMETTMQIAEYQNKDLTVFATVTKEYSKTYGTTFEVEVETDFGIQTHDFPRVEEAISAAKSACGI